jgi:hypothetical protein
VSARARVSALLLLVPVLALGLTACGGQSERTRLLSQLRTDMHQSAPMGVYSDGALTLRVTPGLVNCLVAQAKPLPVSELRQLASANPSRALVLPLLAHCVARGYGAAGVQAAVVQAVSAQLPPELPAVFRTCVEAKVASLSHAQLAQIFMAASRSQTAAQNYGAGLGMSCLRDHPAVVRQLVIVGMRRAMAGSTLPPAFGQCMIGQVEKVPVSELLALLAGGSAATDQAAGNALGRRLAPACVAKVRGKSA